MDLAKDTSLTVSSPLNVGMTRDELLATPDWLPAHVRELPRAYLVPPRESSKQEKSRLYNASHPDQIGADGSKRKRDESETMLSAPSHMNYRFPAAPWTRPPRDPHHGNVQSLAWSFTSSRWEILYEDGFTLATPSIPPIGPVAQYGPPALSVPPQFAPHQRPPKQQRSGPGPSGTARMPSTAMYNLPVLGAPASAQLHQRNQNQQRNEFGSGNYPTQQPSADQAQVGPLSQTLSGTMDVDVAVNTEVRVEDGIYQGLVIAPDEGPDEEYVASEDEA